MSVQERSRRHSAQMSDTVKAFVLDDTVSAPEAKHFANFPGLWITGHPVAVTELGFDTEDEALAAVKELGLPLTLTKVPVGEGLMPEVANHVRAGDMPVAFEDGDVETVAEPEASDPFAEAVALKADELIAAVEASDDLAWLETLGAEEKASKNRTSVVAAIDERITALTPEPEETV